MPNLNEIEEVSEDAAMQWAIEHEFEMRHRRYKFAKEGLIHHIRKMTAAANRFNEALRGIEALEEQRG